MTTKPKVDDHELPNRKRRRWVFRVLTLALVVGVLELLAVFGLRFAFPDFDSDQLVDYQRRLAKYGISQDDSPYAIHPYLGFSHNPQVSPGESAFGRVLPVNGFGFVDSAPAIVRRSKGEFIVVITGGSVAWQLSVGAEHQLKQALESTPRLRGRKLRIVRLAMSGYKQPQQLTAVNFLIACGGEFDAVINIDGYNEVALTWSENVMHGVHSSFPRAWHARTQDVVDPRQYSMSFRLLEVRAKRQAIAQSVTANSIFNKFALKHLWWAIQERNLASEKRQLEDELFGQRLSSRAFVTSGPPEDRDSIDTVVANAAEQWWRSSLQLKSTVEGKNAIYLHVLQPNLYDKGSKPLSDNEKNFHNFQKKAPIRAVEAGYPLLRRASKNLLAHGVNFLDASKVFINEQRTMYSDACCHFTDEGNKRLAQAIIDQLLVLIEAG